MKREPVIIDPRHKRPLPSGRALARVVRQILERQQAAFLRNPCMFQADANAWSVTVFDLLVPIFERYAWEAAKKVHYGEDMVYLARWKRRKVVDGVVYKGVAKNLIGAFDVLAPQILATARRMTFVFLDGFFQSTADMLRAALAASLKAGETGVELQRRLVAIFGRERAAVIGQTEASRATHEGQRIADKESGVIEKRAWLASADACDLCLSLDGKEVGMDEPFYVDPKGGPYAVVINPPRHPNCLCSSVGVF